MGPGHGPARRSTNSNPLSHTECRLVHATAQGRQREEQANPPPKKKTAQKRGNPRPTTNARPPAKTKGGGAGDRQTSAKPQEACNPLSQATPKATPTSTPERTLEDHPARPGNYQPRGAAHRRKSYPGQAGTYPTGEVAGHGQRKQKHRRNPNERGRGAKDQGAQARDRQRRTPQSHDTTGPRTSSPPPAARKKRGGGANTTRGNPRTAPGHRQPHLRVA